MRHSTKSLLVSILILGIIGTGVGLEIFGATASTTSATITPRSIAITRSAGDGTLAYGIVDLSSSTTTDPAGINDVETFRNTGSVAEKFSIQTSTATGGTTWTVTAGAPGVNTYRHSFTTTTVTTWQILDAADTYETASSTVSVSSDVNIYMKIETPSGTSGDYAQKTITITLLAEQS